MAFPVLFAGDCIKMTAAAFLNSQLFEFGVHYVVGTVTGSSLTCREAAASWLSFMIGAWKPCLPPLAVVSGMRCDVYTPATGVIRATGTAADNVTTGTATGLPAATQASAILRKFTGLPGRKNRGRCFIGPIPDQFDPGTGGINNVGIVAYNALAVPLSGHNTVTGGAGSATIDPVLKHRTAAGSPISFTPISSMSATNYKGTQRRRGDLGRKNLPFQDVN